MKLSYEAHYRKISVSTLIHYAVLKAMQNRMYHSIYHLKKMVND